MRKIKTLSSLLVAILLTGCTNETYKEVEMLSKDTPIEVMIATDLHYIAPTLSNDSPALESLMATADGKMTIHSEPIVDAFVDEVLAQSPDALLIPGDVTFNGAKESHVALVEKLSKIEAVGIPVFVIPGNHDIDYSQAARFDKEGYQKVESISTQEFEALYKELMEERILARAPESNSYIASLREDVWLIGIDTNTEKARNRVDDDTLEWVEVQLQVAQAEGIQVIAITHQNVLAHNDQFTKGFMIENADALIDLFKTYGVQLNLSGHMHMQHIEQSGDFYEIATGALAVTPHYYAMLNIDADNEITYQTYPLDIEAWANETGQTEEDLLNFTAYSADYFEQTTRLKLEEQLLQLNLTAEEVAQMIDFATEVNRHYFAGTVSDYLKTISDDKTLALWEAQEGKLFFATYLQSILADEPRNHNHCVITME